MLILTILIMNCHDVNINETDAGWVRYIFCMKNEFSRRECRQKMIHKDIFRD